MLLLTLIAVSARRMDGGLIPPPLPLDEGVFFVSSPILDTSRLHATWLNVIPVLIIHR